MKELRFSSVLSPLAADNVRSRNGHSCIGIGRLTLFAQWYKAEGCISSDMRLRDFDKTSVPVERKLYPDEKSGSTAGSSGILTRGTVVFENRLYLISYDEPKGAARPKAPGG